MLEPSVEEAAAAHGAEGAGSVGDSILHHVMDARELEIPFTTLKIPLPQIELGGWHFDITKHVVMMWVAALGLLVVLLLAARRARQPVPRGLRNLFEVFVVFIRDDIARKAIPHHGDRYLGYLTTTFFFILTCNLLGLVPGMATATGNISVTAGLALLAFAQIQWGGIRQFGLAGHLKNLAPGGVPAWLVPLMVFIEFLGMLIKPFALCIRLFANMMAGHVVILSFISLIFILGELSAVAGWVAAPFAVAMALFINLLEILIALLQAYIFTMLTAQFIGMSVHPAH